MRIVKIMIGKQIYESSKKPFVSTVEKTEASNSLLKALP